MSKTLFSSLLAFVLLALLPGAANGKTSEPAVRTGKLANGLSYYIARAADTAEKASFKLIVRVGNEHGRPELQSAHILEHVVVEKVRDVDTKGSVWKRVSRFGGAVNASTGAFSTSYYVDMPPGNAAAAAAGLDILCDWAAQGVLSDSEIEREHRAVIEEIRRGGTEGFTADQQQQAALFPGHPRLDTEPKRTGVVPASADMIRKLYQDYYVPANIALVITGVSDPDAVLRAITTKLGALPAGKRAPSPTSLPADLSGGHYLAIGADETVAEISFKLRPAPAGSAARIHDLAVAQIAEVLVPQGFANLAEHDGAATAGGFMALTPLYAEVFGTEPLTLRANVRRGAVRDALSQSLALLASLRSTGFAESDVARAREIVAKQTATSSPSLEAAQRWTEIFAVGAAGPTHREVKAAVARLTAADVNRTLARWLDPVHRNIFLFHSEKDRAHLPTAAEVTALTATSDRAGNSSSAISFAPPVVRSPRLASVSFGAGQVPTAIEEAEGVLRWTLPRSGATLLFRHIPRETTRLIMRRAGGEARFPQSAAIGARAAADVVNLSDIGGLNRFELARYLAANNLSISASAGADYEQISASGPASAWQDILALARTRIGGASCPLEAYKRYIEGWQDTLAIDGSFGDDEAFLRMVDAEIGSKWRPETEDLKAFRHAALCDQYRQMFSDSAGMTIVVEGNLSPEAAYRGAAAALDIEAAVPSPVLRTRPAYETSGGRTIMRRGSRKLAKVSLFIAAREPAPDAGLMAEALQLRVFHRLRTVERGVYSPMSGIGVNPPGDGAMMNILFDCAPENVDRLIKAVQQEVDRFGSEGMSDSELQAARSKRGPADMSAFPLAETWQRVGSLKAARPSQTDSELRDWARGFFRSSRMHEFVLLPEDAAG